MTARRELIKYGEMLYYFLINIIILSNKFIKTVVIINLLEFS